MTPAPRTFATPVLAAAGLLGILLAAGSAAGADPDPVAAPAHQPQPVILVGTAGLSWADASPTRTPNLWAMLTAGSVAALSVRSTTTVACPSDGWLGLGAGQRAAARTPAGTCATVTAPKDGRVREWDGWQASAAGSAFHAQLGTLRDAVVTAGGCVQAVGPGAAVAAASPGGAVDRYAEWDAKTMPAQMSACDVTLADAGTVVAAPDSAARAAQVMVVDERLGLVLGAAPSRATVLFASVADDGVEGLRVVAARGPQWRRGWLTSTSTRREGLVQSADLTASVASMVGAVIPGAVVGAPMVSIPGPAAAVRAGALVDLQRHAHAARAVVPWYFNTMVVAGTVLCASTWWLLRRPTRTGGRTWLRRVGLWLAAVPVSTFLANVIPWWRAPVPAVTLVGVVCALAAALAVVAGAWPRGPATGGPGVVVAAVTAVVLAVDVGTGSRLQVASLMGVQPVVGGRFYGLGNTAFAVFAVAVVVVCAAVTATPRRRRVAGVLAGTAVAVVAVVVDAAPGLGADGGGPLALAPGLGLCILVAAGVRVTWPRLLLLLGGGAALVAAVAVGDWSRPPSQRTHLGRFVQSVVDGDAVQVVARKAAANVALVPSWLTILVAAAAVLLVWLLRTPQLVPVRHALVSDSRAPAAALAGGVLLLVVGMLVNDSGVAVGAAGAMLGLPLLVAAFAQSSPLEPSRPRGSGS